MAEQTSLSFDEPHFLPTCGCPFLASLPVVNHGRVSVSDWQKLIPMDSTGESRFATKCPVELEVRGSERSIQHYPYPINL